MGFIGQFSALLKQLPYIPSIISLSIHIIQVIVCLKPSYLPTNLPFSLTNLPTSLARNGVGGRDTHHPWLVIINLFSKLTAAKMLYIFAILEYICKVSKVPNIQASKSMMINLEHMN